MAVWNGGPGVPLKRMAVFAVVGGVSGSAGALLSLALPDPSKLLTPIKNFPGAVFFVPGTAIAFPGIVFGLIFASIFWYRGALRVRAAAAFAAASAIGNCIAISTALALHDVRSGAISGQVYSGDQLLPDWACCAIAGFEGGLLLGAVAMALLHGTARAVLGLAITGMGLGVPFGVASDFTVDFALWQAGYAAVLSLYIPARSLRPAACGGRGR